MVVYECLAASYLLASMRPYSLHFRFAGAKVVVFYETAKLFPKNFFIL